MPGRLDWSVQNPFCCNTLSLPVVPLVNVVTLSLMIVLSVDVVIFS